MDNMLEFEKHYFAMFNKMSYAIHALEHLPQNNSAQIEEVCFLVSHALKEAQQDAEEVYLCFEEYINNPKKLPYE